ncbi:MAG: hypothetical protein KDE14_02110 [Rhodobacteraceae bacterium]|nr:hypothetical protein [Paracoccaceae bacterium]
MTQEQLTAIVFIVGIFLILREFICWYWKQNRIVALLEEIRDRLPQQAGDDGDDAPDEIHERREPHF